MQTFGQRIYDKVITEFPKSEASRIAYKGKLRTLLGWKESGRDEESYGIEASFYMTIPLHLLSGREKTEALLAKAKAEASFEKYMPILLQTFEEFEKDHPNAPTLQAFRYQIAQIYWRHSDYNSDSGNFVLRYPEETKQWLNKVIDQVDGNDSFYGDLAERRLKNLELR